MKRIVDYAPIREAMVLVKSGLPFDVAFELEPEMRQAPCIIAGEFEGGKFNWELMEFEEPSNG